MVGHLLYLRVGTWNAVEEKIILGLIERVRTTLSRSVAIGVKTMAIRERGQAELENSKDKWRLIAKDQSVGEGSQWMKND